MSLNRALTPGLRTAFVLAAFLLVSLPARLPAQMVLFKGFLTDGSGAPLTGAYLLEFGLWDSPLAGNEVWHQSLFVRARSGVFSAVLGSHSPLPGTVVASNHRFGVSAPEGIDWHPRPLAAPRIVGADPRFGTAAIQASAELPQIPAAPVPVPLQALPPVFPGTQLTSPTSQARKIQELQRKLDATQKELRRRRPPRAAKVYVVRKGDTLRTVAQIVYGDSDRWIDLYEANEDRIQRAGDLVPGQRLLIPRRSKSNSD